MFDLYNVPLQCLAALSGTKWAVFNGGFEWRHLTNAGLTVPALHDVMLLDRLVSCELRKLDTVVRDTLGVTLDKSLQVSDWGNAELSQEQLHYAAMDALATVRSAEVLLRKVNEQGQRRLYNLWCDVLPVLSDLSLRGQTFDWDTHRRLADSWEKERTALLIELKNHLGGGINPNSGPQLGEWLKHKLSADALDKWPVTATGRLKTDGPTLKLFGTMPVIKPLLRYKEINKLINTYDTGYAKYRHPVTDKLHPAFTLGRTRSGRLAASRPNTQNPPRLPTYRELFIPEPGLIMVGADFSQIELRVAALLSNDTAMLDAYSNGIDLHRNTAAAVAGLPLDKVTDAQRTSAKAINFGTLYGSGPAGLARSATLDYGVAMTTAEARKALNRFTGTYPELAMWKAQKVVEATMQRTVTTRLGLVRDFDKQGEGYLKGECQNIPVQGSAGEVLLSSIARLPAALQGLDAKLYHNIHDEIQITAHPEAADAVGDALQECMVQGFLDVFPEAESMAAAVVDKPKVGSTWRATH